MPVLRRRLKRALLLPLLAPPLLLGGCTAAGDGTWSNPFEKIFSPAPRDPTPEEREMQEDAKIFRNTVLGGAATVGAVVFLDCLLGRGTGEWKDCAAIGGVGAVVGAIDGYLTAKRQEASRRKVREIDLITEEIEEKNAGIRKLVESSRKVVEQNRERIGEVKLKIARNEVREEVLAEEKGRLEANIAVMDRTIENLTKDKETYRTLADKLEGEGRDVALLRENVESMEHRIAELEEQRDELEEINRAVRIG